MGKGPLLWVAGFAGVFLMYAAFKGKTGNDILSLINIEPGSAATKPVPPSTDHPSEHSGGASNPDDPTVLDSNGNDTSVPSMYQSNPGTFVPS